MVRGVASYPAERTGEKYEVTFRARDSPVSRLRLKDIHARDKHHLPVYRQYRGGRFAVYEAPYGLGTMQRRRSDGTWQAYLFVDGSLTTNMLILLGRDRGLFLSIHEMKAERVRWVRNISLQSTNPAEE